MTSIGAANAIPSCTSDVPSINGDEATPANVSGALQNLSDKFAADHRSNVLDPLTALLPRSATLKDRAGPLSIESCGSAYLKLLVYSLSNNFAGHVFDCISLPELWKYLGSILSQIQLLHLRADAEGQILGRLLSLKPLAETLFQCALEAGDGPAVKKLLLWEEGGLHAENIICFLGPYRVTAAEKASNLGHLDVIDVLILEDVDLNRTLEHSSHLAHGALEHAVIFANRLSSTSLSLEIGEKLFNRLIDTGGRAVARRGLKISSEFIERLVHRKSGAVLTSFAAHLPTEDLDAWLLAGFFHRCIDMLDPTYVKRVVGSILDRGLDLGISPRCAQIYSLLPNFAWALEEQGNMSLGESPMMIDLAAWRGLLPLVDTLQRSGAAPTTNTLVAAILGGNMDLVWCLLSSPSINVHLSAEVFSTTPYAQAMLLGNPRLMQHLQRLGCYDSSLSSPERASEMLVAAATIGNYELVQSILLTTDAEDLNPTVLWIALYQAVSRRHTSTCLLIIGHADDFDRPRDSLRALTTSPLREALRQKAIPIIIALLESPAYPLNEDDEDVKYLVKSALEWQDTEITDRLFAMGISLNIFLFTAIDQGNLAAIRLLMERGVGLDGRPVTEFCKCPETPLLHAVEAGNVDILGELLEQGASIANARAWCTAITCESPLVEQLIHRYKLVYPHGKPGFGAHVITQAIQKGDHGLVRHLLEIGMSTALFQEPCEHHYPHLFQEDHPSRNHGSSPLLGAIRLRGPAGLDMAQIVLEFDSNVNVNIPRGARSAIGYVTPLLVAIQSRNVEMVRLLLQHGASVDAPAMQHRRRTPLQLAAELGSTAIVELLISQGADVNAAPASHRGATALQLAAGSGSIGIAEILLDNGADIHARAANVCGRTALAAAAEQGRFGMINTFLSIDNFSEAETSTAINFAKLNGYEAVVKLLQDPVINMQPRNTSNFQAPSSQVTPMNGVAEEVPARRQHHCAGCLKSFTRAYTLHRHIRERHTQSSFPCNICHQDFTRQEAVDRHKETVHRGRRTTCPTCGKDFSRKDYLYNSHAKKCSQDIIIVE